MAARTAPKPKKLKVKKPPKPFNPKGRIIAALRRIWFYSPLRREAVKRAKDGNKFKCEACEEFHEKIVVDHIQPVVTIETGFTGWDSYIERLFCPVEGLQVMCKTCHDAKSMVEKEMRKFHKTKGKE